MTSTSVQEMVALTPLLTTKLHIPRRRRVLVARPRLSARLSRGNEVPLTLVSAPAGFGKTTVLTEWLAADPPNDRPVAWLSLDERDNDPALFWAYVIAALRTVDPQVGGDALDLLRSSSTDAVLAALVNDLSELADDVVLVLDDYHVIDSGAVQDGMAFLLDHLPAQVHLVIASRADPALPLARMRGRGELVEVRAADLRFTPDESADYLVDAMGLALTAQDVAALEGHTEGWIAALQLAALSMQDRTDVASFVAGFAGDDRYIVDYLVEEVLQRQPERVRTFLLQTSILGRLTGPLCDAVTGRDDGKDMLEALDRANLFLIPLDDQRRWYRYHHLFADVLRAHLGEERPGTVADLHRRAGQWHESTGELAEAVAHAFAAGDVGHAADLIEPALPALQQGRQEATMRRWLEAVPDEVMRMRPVLSIGLVATLMVRGEVQGVEARLQDAERWLNPPPGGPAGGRMVVVDEDAFRRLPTAIAMYRAGLALLSGDLTSAMTYAGTALDLAGTTDDLGRGSAAGLLGLAHWRLADLDTAHTWWADAATSLERAGHLTDVTGCALAMADIRLAQGNLSDAMATYQRTLQLLSPAAGPVLRGAADMHAGVGAVLTERGELDGARRHLEASRDLGEPAGLPQNPYRWRVAMARLRAAEGHLDDALAILDEAARRYAADYFPEVRPVAAVRARLYLRQGRWADALAWAEQRELSADDDPDYLREFEHLTLARTLVARHAAEPDDDSVAGALRLLARLLPAAEAAGRTGSVLDLLVVQALALQASGDTRAALGALQRALALAEPQGYVRILLDEGEPMVALLTAIAAEGRSAGFARRLLAVGSSSGTGTPAPARLIDPLSSRELDVLRLLGTDLDGPDIARALFVSVNTVRTHTKNIYAKLGVTSRRAAVRRAEALQVLSLTGDRPTR